MDFIFNFIIKVITFIVSSFVWLVNFFVSIFFILLKFLDVYIYKSIIVNFLYKVVIKKMAWSLYYSLITLVINFLVFPFVFFDSLLNVLILVFSFSFKFFFILVEMFFNFFLSFFSNYLSFLLIPEVLILFSSVLALLIFIRTKISFTNDRFFNELAAVFGKSNVERISVGSYEYSVLIRFHNAKKRLTAILYSWWVSFVIMIFSFFWLLVSTYELYSVKFYFNFERFSFLKVGLNDFLFSNSFYYDSFSQSSRLFILFISLIFMILYRFEIKNDSRLRRIEFLFLFLVGCALSLLMVSSSSLLSLFLSVEGLVMVMYVLTAGSSISSGFPIVKILRFRAVEGALKYAITNAVATGFFLLGSSLIFFFTGGDIYFVSIFKTLNTLSLTLDFNSFNHLFIYFGLLLGSILIALTFLFKLGIVPFHNWMADLYEASVPGVFAFFLVVPKAAILFTFLNLNRFIFSPFGDVFSIIFLFLGLVSVVVGSVHAIYQLKIERLLAYSSVAHAGGFLLLLSAVHFSSDRPYSLVVFFLIAYILVNALFLAVFLSLRYSPSFFSHSYIKYFKVFSNLPLSAQKVLATVFFNLAGLPPFLGWFLKALVLIVWVKVCFFSSSDSLIVGSNLESLFDFGEMAFSTSLVASASYIQFSLSSFLLNTILFVFSFFGISFSDNLVLLFFCKKLSIFLLTFFILFVFLILVVSTFYYVRLVNTIYGSSTNSGLILEKQGLLNLVSLDVAILIFLLFSFNVLFLFFYTSMLTFIDIFFIRFSIGF